MTKQNHDQSQGTSYRSIVLLILAGEAAFLLPFVLPRIFRPTVLEVFGLDNSGLGACYSVYGFVALASYLFGGPIADRFPPRKLMAIALWCTSLGGLAMSTYPSDHAMRWIYGYWGFTTIFLFWAAMLKATRQWGGDKQQGKAFGFLDGGRGLVSAIMAMASVSIYSWVLGDAEDLQLVDQQNAFRQVILATSVTVGFIGVLVWCFLDLGPGQNSADLVQERKVSVADVVSALKLPSVWLLMIIVLCGYVGYKVTDDFSLFANEVMLASQVESARLAVLLLFIRPVVGVVAGFLADWSRASTWITGGFCLMLVGAVLFASGIIAPGGYMVFAISLLATCLGVYAIRSLYFAAMQEGNIPLPITGTAVGLISVVGYTPDIFMGPVMGRLLDQSPGEVGHRHLFQLLAGFSVVGCAAALVFLWKYTGLQQQPTQD